MTELTNLLMKLIVQEDFMDKTLGGEHFLPNDYLGGEVIKLLNLEIMLFWTLWTSHMKPAQRKG